MEENKAKRKAAALNKMVPARSPIDYEALQSGDEPQQWAIGQFCTSEKTKERKRVALTT